MRYTNSKHAINYADTLEFFEARGRQARPDAPQTATMYQDRELAERRDACEKETVLPLLSLRGGEKVLDLGCGYGRWAQVLAGTVGSYLGIDFSAELLRLAEKAAPTGCVFQRSAAQDVTPSSLVVKPPFDLFICAGILIYLNDADVARLSRAIASMAAPRATVYLREPMGVAGRLTLDRFPSAELKQDYSAIYRTPAECHELFGEPLRAAGFKLSVERPLYPPELCNRKETEQQIQIWSRAS
jgi:cyclopropane fatty-acyl-phospholipid synthase-like methyltransferase